MPINPYSAKPWLEFRNTAIKLAEGKCERCGKDQQHGAILQVHHKKYQLERKPWEYDHHECEVLCKGCHAEAHGLIQPHSDWELVGEDDLGDLSGTCDYCGIEIRTSTSFNILNGPQWELESDAATISPSPKKPRNIDGWLSAARDLWLRRVGGN